MPPEAAAQLVNEGLISWIKYAIVRDNPAVDPYLTKLIDLVDRKLIVSGIGEQPAIIHLRDFSITGFTSGCVCVAPALSMKCMAAIHREDYAEAEAIRAQFEPLEDQRNSHGPIPVLHQAVQLAGVADTGPFLPLLAPLADERLPAIKQAALELLAKN
jgi:dihydrodipicolinate synthase/N-acetylneuraminate lyase